MSDDYDCFYDWQARAVQDRRIPEEAEGDGGGECQEEVSAVSGYC